MEGGWIVVNVDDGLAREQAALAGCPSVQGGAEGDQAVCLANYLQCALGGQCAEYSEVLRFPVEQFARLKSGGDGRTHRPGKSQNGVPCVGRRRAAAGQHHRAAGRGNDA